MTNYDYMLQLVKEQNARDEAFFIEVSIALREMREALDEVVKICQ